MTPEKGRPPPGGEEAEVVVYQPRGVGLMHTRHKPSDAHYTHAGAGWRKTATQRSRSNPEKIAVLATCRELPICTICRDLSLGRALCWRCDLIRPGDEPPSC
ncbi:hypothetical protein BST22_11385 [Mycolicibacterium chubuense]|nr:hypothetical protein BST22_11385 [Mycolicibacterium chubuense]